MGKQENDCMVFYQKIGEKGESVEFSPKEQKMLAGKTLKHAFFEFFGEEMNEDKIFREENGKPGYAVKGHFFNISHCRNAIAAAVANFPVGVDIEGIRPVKYPVVKKCMDGQERAYIGPREEEWLNPGQVKRFLELWTLKESYVKMMGEGIRMPLDKICFETEDLGERRVGKEIFYIRNRIIKPWQQNSISCLLPVEGQALALALQWECDTLPRISCVELK